jgi:hypothetical protein
MLREGIFRQLDLVLFRHVDRLGEHSDREFAEHVD